MEEQARQEAIRDSKRILAHAWRYALGAGNNRIDMGDISMSLELYARIVTNELRWLEAGCPGPAPGWQTARWEQVEVEE